MKRQEHQRVASAARKVPWPSRGHDQGRRRRRSPLLALGIAGALLSVPVALAATPNRIQPGQRVDVKVLLVAATGTEAPYTAWKAALEREGMPYDTFVADQHSALVDADLADYTAKHARYSGVILASGDLAHQVTNPDGSVSFPSAFSDAEWSTLTRFEQSFGLRRLSDDTAPSPAHGLNFPTEAAEQGGQTLTLTDAGKAAFPYLKSSVPVDTGAFGYEATPVSTTDFTTLLADSAGHSFLGVYTHPEDGREEMVATVTSNEFQTHNQLLRHGMLNWVTRGVYLGYQRNYLELQIDDVFLGDDSWNATTHQTDYDAASAVRMSPTDVARAVTWSQANDIRLDFAYNGGGSALYGEQNNGATDPLVAPLQASKNVFGWINHTYEHPNLNCSTQSYIASQISQNVAFAQANALPIDASELVTGEHSGLANTRPGNPGTLDPPAFSEALNAAGTLADGEYKYALSATSASGETVASTTNVTVPAPSGGIRLAWDVTCSATSYKIYRSPGGTAPEAWTLLRTIAPTSTTTDDGTNPREESYTDTGADAGTAVARLPATNTAAVTPYAQNAAFKAALASQNILTTASDASKTYPQTPTSIAGPQYVAGASWVDGFRAIPRYPTNVYYNTATQAQQLDEYNWLYNASKGCVAVPDVTTCNAGDVTWAQYVASEGTIMLRHLTGNDPRPHYFHQTNIAQTDQIGGGVFYPVIDALLERYRSTFKDSPLIQLTQTQIGAELARQAKWANDVSSGRVSAFIQDGRLHVDTTATMEVPVTGTTVGSLYGGQTSGWTTVNAAGELVLDPKDPVGTAAPAVSGTTTTGSTLTATAGAWSGTGTITTAIQWQKCNAAGEACASIAGATGASYQIAAADEGARLRIVVSAGNWISSVSQAVSAAGAAVTKPPVETPVDPTPTTTPTTPVTPAAPVAPATPVTPAVIKLTGLGMTPRKFAVAHRAGTRRRGSAVDGATVRWRVNRAAKLRFSVQRRDARGRWRAAGSITRNTAAGAGTLRFTGRVGGKLLARSRYRLVVRATAGGRTTPAKTLQFRVVAG